MKGTSHADPELQDRSYLSLEASIAARNEASLGSVQKSNQLVMFKCKNVHLIPEIYAFLPILAGETA